MSLVAVAAMTTAVMGANFVEVRSIADCPTAEEVANRLRPMLPKGWLTGPTGDVASIEMVEARADGVAGLRLLLVRSDGSMRGDRRLFLPGGCAERADAIAGIVAAWETDFWPAQPPSAGLAASANPPSSPNASDRSSLHLEITLGVFAGAAMIDGVAAAAGLEAVGGKLDSRWQLRLAAATETARPRRLEQGEVSWDHTTFSVGLVLRSLGPSWRFAVDAGPILGWATLGGQGYAENRKESPFEYGVGTGLRMERALGHLALWLEWRTSLWTKNQQAVLTGSTNSAKLSTFDMMVNLGGSVTYFP